jgi:type IV pilus assembly protein PilW
MEVKQVGMRKPVKTVSRYQEFTMFRNQSGFTLVELLVVVALTGIVTAAVYKSFSAQQQVYTAQDQVVSMQQEIRASLDMMMRELRMGGYDPVGTANAAITVADSFTVTFTVDQNGNGTLIDTVSGDGESNEQIRYALSNDTAPQDGRADGFPCNLGRESWSGGLQPVSENVEVLNLVYLDANNQVIPTPITGETLDTIRSVQICIVARADKEDKNFTNTSSYSNLQGTVILPSANDKYRRRLLTATVNCRNLGI